MTATGLRHHCATMSHVRSKNLDKEGLAEFMGHTLDVHKSKYRYPLGIIQRGQIGPHLLKLGGVDITKALNTDKSKKSDDGVHTSQSDVDEDSESTSDDDAFDRMGKKKKPKFQSVVSRRRWSEEEKSKVIEYFIEFVRCRKLPGKNLCQKLIMEEPLLKGRTWAQVNALIDNYNREKAHLPTQYEYLRNC